MTDCFCNKKIGLFDKKLKCWFNGCNRKAHESCFNNKDGLLNCPKCKVIYCKDHVDVHGCENKSMPSNEANIVLQGLDDLPELKESEIKIFEENLELNDETKEMLDKRIKSIDEGKIMTSDELMKKLGFNLINTKVEIAEDANPNIAIFSKNLKVCAITPRNIEQKVSAIEDMIENGYYLIEETVNNDTIFFVNSSNKDI